MMPRPPLQLDVTALMLITVFLGIAIFLFIRRLADAAEPHHGHSHGGRPCNGHHGDDPGEPEQVEPSALPVYVMKADLRDVNVEIKDDATKAEITALHEQHCREIIYYKGPVEGTLIMTFPQPSGKMGMIMRFANSEMEQAWMAMSEKRDAEAAAGEKKKTMKI